MLIEIAQFTMISWKNGFPMAQYALEAGVSWLATSVTVVASATWRAAKWSHRWITDQAEEPEEDDDSPTIHELFDHREKEFHNYVRQQIICMWLFMLLYLFAYWVISRLKRKTEKEALYAGEEDYFVYRVSVWISSAATATSIGSLTLLPFSVIGVELLQLYDGNYYLQWLSYSLIGALWNYVFMLSNVSLFVLLPFSYFFIESQGFSTTKHGNHFQGITERIYEAMAVCFLFAFVLLCLAEVVLKILDYPVSFLSITSVNLPLIYSCVSFIGALLLLISTPYGFSRMFTYAREFLTVDEEVEVEQETEEDNQKTSSEVEDVVVEENLETLRDYPARHEEVVQEASDVGPSGDMPTHPSDSDPRKDSDSGIDSGSTEEMRLDSEEDDVTLEEEVPNLPDDDDNDKEPFSATMTPRRRRRWNFRSFESPPLVRTTSTPKKKPQNPNYDYRNLNNYVKNYYRQERKRRQRSSLSDSKDDYWWTSRTFCRDYDEQEDVVDDEKQAKTAASGDFHEAPALSSERRTKSEEAIWRPVIDTVKTSRFYKKAVEKRSRFVKFVMGMRMPVVVTILLILTTCSIVMVAINTLKLSFGYRSLPVYAQIIEVSTRHSFGLFGACVETLIIMYVMCTSFVGLYSLPLLRSLRPVRKDTPMPTIIINSSIILVVASALPVIVNTLGMTTFDLLGAHSSLQWLGLFRVVLAYNAAFVVLSVAFLANQLTASMRRQIWKWICHLRCACRRRPRDEVDPDDTIIILGGKKDN